MIRTIIDLLKSNDWHGTGSELIEIAKGKNQLPTTVKQVKRKIKRQWQSKK